MKTDNLGRAILEDQEVLEQMLSSKRLNSVLLIQNWIRSILNRINTMHFLIQEAMFILNY